jgi:hypothetical protein
MITGSKDPIGQNGDQSSTQIVDAQLNPSICGQ